MSSWCPDHAICIEWIDRRAIELVENFQDADTVYMSLDVYKQFMDTMQANLRGVQPPVTGFNVVQIMTTIGMLTVKPVPYFSNFCHVGTQMTYEELEWAKVNQEFEDAVMKDFDRV